MAPAPETGDRLPAHKWGARPSPKDDRDLLLEKSPALARASFKSINPAALSYSQGHRNTFICSRSIRSTTSKGTSL